MKVGGGGSRRSAASARRGRTSNVDNFLAPGHDFHDRPQWPRRSKRDSHGGSVSEADLKAKATVTANWTTDTLSYSVVVESPFSKTKTYTGSTKF
jgi:hypothetical protein